MTVVLYKVSGGKVSKFGIITIKNSKKCNTFMVSCTVAYPAVIVVSLMSFRIIVFLLFIKSYNNIRKCPNDFQTVRYTEITFGKKRARVSNRERKSGMGASLVGRACSYCTKRFDHTVPASATVNNVIGKHVLIFFTHLMSRSQSLWRLWVQYIKRLA